METKEIASLARRKQRGIGPLEIEREVCYVAVSLDRGGNLRRKDSFNYVNTKDLNRIVFERYLSMQWKKFFIRSFSLAAAMGLTATPAAAAHEHLDVFLVQETGTNRIATGGFSDVTGTVEEFEFNMFPREAEGFGANVGFLGDLGFRAPILGDPSIPAGFEVLPDQTDLDLDAKAFEIGGVTRNVHYWSGDLGPNGVLDASDWSDVPDDVTVRFERSPSIINFLEVDGSGFDIDGNGALPQETGHTGTAHQIHQHIDVFIHEANNDTLDTYEGVYWTELTVDYTSGSNEFRTDLMSVFFSAGLDDVEIEERLELAEAFIETQMNPVPVPAAAPMGVVCLSLVFLRKKWAKASC